MNRFELNVNFGFLYGFQEQDRIVRGKMTENFADRKLLVSCAYAIITVFVPENFIRSFYPRSSFHLLLCVWP
jgi:hypothetical protein